MEFGVMTEPQLGMTYDDQLDVARFAERIGLDVFARSDHYGFPGFEDPHATDAFASLAGLARETDRIGLCVLVSPVTFRHPAVIAKSAATIDEMSKGRLILGVGTGWMEEEHAQFGLPFPEWGERFARLEEARWLAEHIRMTALIDLSDGLAGDMGHVAAASGVAIVLDPALIPVAPGVVAAAGSRRRALPLALVGGEDYELAFTAPPGSMDSLAADFHRGFGIPLTRVGIVTGGAGVRLEGDGADEFDPGSAGFDHFRAPRSDAADVGRSDSR